MILNKRDYVGRLEDFKTVSLKIRFQKTPQRNIKNMLRIKSCLMIYGGTKYNNLILANPQRPKLYG